MSTFQYKPDQNRESNNETVSIELDRYNQMNDWIDEQNTEIGRLIQGITDYCDKNNLIFLNDGQREIKLLTRQEAIDLKIINESGERLFQIYSYKPSTMIWIAEEDKCVWPLIEKIKKSGHSLSKEATKLISKEIENGLKLFIEKNKLK